MVDRFLLRLYFLDTEIIFIIIVYIYLTLACGFLRNFKTYEYHT